MEISGQDRKEKRYRAKKRVEQLKGFYWHMAVYLVVNLLITVGKVVRETMGGRDFIDSFMDFGTFAIWFFWGIGLAFHAAKVFSNNLFFGKEWEERQIRKFMEKERSELDKFNK